MRPCAAVASPFPGMDPYLEDPELFSEFHGTMTYTLRNELNRLLSRGYGARFDRYEEIADTPPANPPLREPDAAWARELLAMCRPPAESPSPKKE